MKASSPRYLEMLAKRARSALRIIAGSRRSKDFSEKSDQVGMHKTRNRLVDIERRSKEGAKNDFVFRRQPLFHHMHFFFFLSIPFFSLVNKCKANL